jgi:hypothetical protein
VGSVPCRQPVPGVLWQRRGTLICPPRRRPRPPQRLRARHGQAKRRPLFCPPPAHASIAPVEGSRGGPGPGHPRRNRPGQPLAGQRECRGNPSRVRPPSDLPSCLVGCPVLGPNIRHDPNRGRPTPWQPRKSPQAARAQLAPPGHSSGVVRPPPASPFSHRRSHRLATPPRDRQGGARTDVRKSSRPASAAPSAAGRKRGTPAGGASPSHAARGHPF